MILLIWSSERSRECAQTMEREFDQPVRISASLEQACEELKSGAFLAVVLDQWLYDGWPAKADFLFQHLGSAAPVIVNFAISTTDRVVRTVRTSLDQRKREMRLARRQACALLKAELKDNLTSLSLSCQMGLQDASLTACAAEQIRRIEEIGKDMQQKLAAEELQEATTAAHA